jgi:hypothetical protein
MKDYLSNKSIAIVGNSEHLHNLKIGKVIDSYDVVIRLNRFNVEDFKIDVGERVDVWGTCLFWKVIPINPNDIFNRHIKNYFVSLPHKSKYIEDREIRRNIKQASNMGYTKVIESATYVDTKLFDSLCDFIGDNKRPNTGTTLIHWVLNNVNYKKIYLAGFSLGKKKWHYNQKDYGTIGQGLKRHNPEKESNLIIDYLNDRINVDPFMEEIINENIHKHKA